MSLLSYFDSLLTTDDVQLLHKKNWINDKLIGFCYEYFEREQFKEHADSVTFISPDVTQFIKMAGDDDIGIFLEPLNLGEKKYVFLAVNNNTDTEHSGGSHWSLVCYNVVQNEMQHYDSFGGSNKQEAKHLCDKLAKYIAQSEGNQPVYKDIDTPQQQNSSDCGMYVICITEELCNVYLKANCTKQGSLETIITPQYVTQYRIHLHDLIMKLAAKS